MAITFRLLAIGTVAALLTTSAAQAATIANHDDKDASVTVIEGPAREERILKPGKAISGICQKGCIVRLNDSNNDEYELDGSERVSVEDGFLYYDGPDASAAPTSGGNVEEGQSP